jgi:RHS repeat-associated protein
MRTNRETPLYGYHYDALDRLVECTPAEQAGTRRFYQKSRLATEIQDLVQHSIFQHDDQLLAQRQRQGGTVATTLLSTDQQRSVLNALDATPPRSIAYTPYGHRSPGNGLLSLLGFNGERPDPVTGHYHLGNGYRQFNPVLMRFNSPDSWSPFGKGGINAYAYCGGDPINRADPTGHLVLTLLNTVAMRGGIGRVDRFSPFTEALFQVKTQLGGTKGIRAKAFLAGEDSKIYLFNKAVKSMVDESEEVINKLKNRINTSTNLDSTIVHHFEYAKNLGEYNEISTRLGFFDDFLNENNKAKANLWSATLDEWYKEGHAAVHNRITVLAQARHPDPPPPYSRHASPPPYPGDARDNIRQ